MNKPSSSLISLNHANAASNTPCFFHKVNLNFWCHNYQPTDNKGKKSLHICAHENKIKLEKLTLQQQKPEKAPKDQNL